MREASSRYQIPKADRTKAAKAPSIGSILSIRPIASPGKATWVKASPTSAMRFKTIKEPKKPAAPPTKIPTKRRKRRLVSITVMLLLMLHLHPKELAEDFS